MNPSRLTLIAIVCVLIPTLYGLDVVLERIESAELHSEAQGLYDQGTKLLTAGNSTGAVEPLHRAYTLVRENRQYQLAYAESMIGAGQLENAGTLLNDVSRRASNDGQTNLLLARLARARHDFADETEYYHRAIYGGWPRDAAAHVSEARLEWIRELAGLAVADPSDRKLMLGELLPLEVETQDFDVLKQTAHYLRIAGAPARAIELYRTLLVTHRYDPELLKGLSQAEAEVGDYQAAQNTLGRALDLNPDDASIQHDMTLVSDLSAIDPTSRRLPSRTKYERSARILALVRDSVRACGSQQAQLADADRTLNLQRPDTSNEAAERVLQMAQDIWRGRPPSCSMPEVLPVIMQKLEQ